MEGILLRNIPRAGELKLRVGGCVVAAVFGWVSPVLAPEKPSVGAGLQYSPNPGERASLPSCLQENPRSGAGLQAAS